jgi:hypothetical protein
VTTAAPGHLGGFPVTAAAGRVLGKATITLGLDGALGTSIRLDEQELSQADPAGLITRLENRLARLEEEKTGALAGIGRAQREIAHAHDSIGKPFSQAGQLAAARERARRISQELDQMAVPPQADDQPGKEPSAEPTPEADPGREPVSLSIPAPAAHQESHAITLGPASDPARQVSRQAADSGNGRHHPGAGQAREVTADPGATAESAQPREHTQDRDAAATAEDPAPARHGARSPGSRHLERQHGPQAETTPADPEAGS